MYSTYQIQLTIFHAICMILPLNIFLYMTVSWQLEIVVVKNGLITFKQQFIYNLLPLNFLFLFYSICTIKGVSEKLSF